MTIKVLIVDDSPFICKFVKKILDQDAEFDVLACAMNGQEALMKTTALSPDVIIMDVEMPVMDGITAVRKIMANCPTPILMFSALTQVGAKATLDALNAGAVDYLPKRLEDIDKNPEFARYKLCQRVKSVARMSRIGSGVSLAGASAANLSQVVAKNSLKTGVRLGNHLTMPSLEEGGRRLGLTARCANSPVLSKIKLLTVVASTGGPVAIQQVLSSLAAGCSFPVLIVQHMPANFTPSFAERLNQICKIPVREARQDDFLEDGKALLAPGGQQLLLKMSSKGVQIELRPKLVNEIYAPSADITLESVAHAYQDATLTVVMTGMGSDGRLGAVQLKRGRHQVWAQDEVSSTVYGMPKAIAEANLADRILGINEIAALFKTLR